MDDIAQYSSATVATAGTGRRGAAAPAVLALAAARARAPRIAVSYRRYTVPVGVARYPPMAAAEFLTIARGTLSPDTGLRANSKMGDILHK